MRIAIATCRELPEPDLDEKPLLEALRGLGAEAEMLAWDGEADFSAFDLCVIRSTWNYIHRLPAFLAWAERAARQTRLFNPASVVRWNTDKGYLHDLERRGFPVVPTLLVPAGNQAPLKDLLAERPWPELVLKPRVGAGSFATRKFSAGELEQADEFLGTLCQRGDAMVQPFVRSVEGHGERALVWIAGEITHAVRKSPRLEGDAESTAPAPILADEREFALKVLEPFAQDLLYARVDLARDEAGGLMVMELELVEPSLFLSYCPPALKRLAERCAALARR